MTLTVIHSFWGFDGERSTAVPWAERPPMSGPATRPRCQSPLEGDSARYEEMLAENAERHATPDALAYAQRLRHRRAISNGTDTLGFALLILHG